MQKILQKLSVIPICILFVLPISNNYQLKSYEFGGGGGVSQSTTYGIEGIVEQGGVASSSGYGIQEGLVFQQNAAVPSVVLVNSSSWYNKLHVTILPYSNASDTTYAIAISADNFATTSYVQSDNTVGASLGSEDYQTHTNWGSTTGEDIIGLTPATTYKVKVKAIQGQYTESAYGPISSAATVNPSLTFDIDVSAIDTETASPYAITMNNLPLSTVTTATEKIWIDLASNAASGAYVYLYGTYSGLRSSNVNHTITSSSTNLASATEGYGVRGDTATNLTKVAPYSGASDNVGLIDTTIREILHSGGAPVTGGRASVLVKVKTSNATPASNDYTDTLTFIASSTF